VILHDISNSFAVNYIKELVAKGIANGYDDDTFRPENPSSRIEYLKMVLRSFNIDYSSANTSGVPFLDVNKNSWEAKVIAKALELNIIN
jgi:lactocepin